jgi:uncharacterized protein YlxW (UPF0749 family)
MVGVLMAGQWQPQAADASVAAPSLTQTSVGDIAATINHLESEQTALKSQLNDLRSRTASTRTEADGRKANLHNVGGEAEQRMVAGVMPVHGPGVVARLDDSAAPDVPADEDASNYIIHDYDLRDVLNALWIAGAEAISLNGERIVSTTSLYCVGSTIVCNITRLSPPYEIHAIGDPQSLLSALRDSPQMAKLNHRAEAYDLPFTAEQRQDVLIPALTHPFEAKYATISK